MRVRTRDVREEKGDKGDVVAGEKSFSVNLSVCVFIVSRRARARAVKSPEDRRVNNARGRENLLRGKKSESESGSLESRRLS